MCVCMHRARMGMWMCDVCMVCGHVGWNTRCALTMALLPHLLLAQSHWKSYCQGHSSAQVKGCDVPEVRKWLWLWFKLLGFCIAFWCNTLCYFILLVFLSFSSSSPSSFSSLLFFFPPLLQLNNVVLRGRLQELGLPQVPSKLIQGNHLLSKAV